MFAASVGIASLADALTNVAGYLQAASPPDSLPINGGQHGGVVRLGNKVREVEIRHVFYDSVIDRSLLHDVGELLH